MGLGGDVTDPIDIYCVGLPAECGRILAAGHATPLTDWLFALCVALMIVGAVAERILPRPTPPS